MAQLMITYEWSDWRNAPVWWIQSVYVAPAHRRKGLFKALYQHARQQAQHAGAAGLRLYADNDNLNAHTTVVGGGSHNLAIYSLFPKQTVHRDGDVKPLHCL